MSELSASAHVASAARSPTEAELREVATALRGMRFGSVTIVVQDGVVIQIDKTEKRRLRTRSEFNGRDRS